MVGDHYIKEIMQISWHKIRIIVATEHHLSCKVIAAKLPKEFENWQSLILNIHIKHIYLLSQVCNIVWYTHQKILKE